MSAAGTYNFCIVRSVLFGPLQIACKDGEGDPVDLTGWSVYAKAALRVIPSRTADLKPSITNEPGGVITIQLTGEETQAIAEGLYDWDLVLENPDGDRVGPILAGTITVQTPVTRPT